MNTFEQPTICGCNKPDCYFCWLRNRVYTTTALVDIKPTDNAYETELYGILAKVSMASGVTIDDILGRSREAKIRIARQMFCYIAAKKGKWTQEQISAAIGYNRTTVTHSCTVVKNMLEARQSEHMEYVDLGCKLGIL